MFPGAMAVSFRGCTKCKKVMLKELVLLMKGGSSGVETSDLGWFRSHIEEHQQKYWPYGSNHRNWKWWTMEPKYLAFSEVMNYTPTAHHLTFGEPGSIGWVCFLKTLRIDNQRLQIWPQNTFERKQAINATRWYQAVTDLNIGGFPGCFTRVWRLWFRVPQIYNPDNLMILHNLNINVGDFIHSTKRLMPINSLFCSSKTGGWWWSNLSSFSSSAFACNQCWHPWGHDWWTFISPRGHPLLEAQQKADRLNSGLPFAAIPEYHFRKSTLKNAESSQTSQRKLLYYCWWKKSGDHLLGCITPCKSWDKLPINRCRISAINSIFAF